MTVTSVAVVTKKFLFGTCNCMVNSYVGIGDLLFLLGVLHVHGLIRSMPLLVSVGNSSLNFI